MLTPTAPPEIAAEYFRRRRRYAITITGALLAVPLLIWLVVGSIESPLLCVVTLILGIGLISVVLEYAEIAFRCPVCDVEFSHFYRKQHRVGLCAECGTRFAKSPSGEE